LTEEINSEQISISYPVTEIGTRRIEFFWINEFFHDKDYKVTDSFSMLRKI